MADLKKTVFHSKHTAAQARMAAFGGWDMPIQYQGILAEHQAVRSRAGLFDISHMGQLYVRGNPAWLDSILTNHAAGLSPGTGHYSFLLNQAGGVIDDLFVYRLADEEYLLILNAAVYDQDLAWLREHLGSGIELDDRSGMSAALAMQGPLASLVADKFFTAAGISIELPRRNRIQQIPELDLLIAATGYTGEAGYELFFPVDRAESIWDGLFAAANGQLELCGLGARDSLRLEMGYPLNGADLDAYHTPLEAGTAWAVNMDKGDFIGRTVLEAQLAQGLKEKLTGFQVVGKSPPPRAHYPILAEGSKISESTSAILSPTLGIGIGLSYLPVKFSNPGNKLEIEIRGKKFPIVTCRRPFYKPGKK